LVDGGKTRREEFVEAVSTTALRALQRQRFRKPKREMDNPQHRLYRHSAVGVISLAGGFGGPHPLPDAKPSDGMY
jgi:hypothetical protein